MCIYLGDRDDLTYNKQEHVFPAGLGGKQMLNNGVVSDQANEMFSPLELKLMHSSLIAFDRMMFGPGKRGSLNPRDASKSRVNVGQQDNGLPILCYTALAKPYNIPQFYLHENEFVVSAPVEYNDSEKHFNDFCDSLKKFEEKYVYLQSDYVPIGDILIGSYNGTIYVSSAAEYLDKQKVQKEITRFLNGFKIQDIHKSEHHTKQSLLLEENSDIARVYAKVAINALAFLKGQDYVKHPNFNEIKKWIVTGNPESEEKYSFLPGIQNKPLDIMGIIPDKAHWCFFVCNHNSLEAIVCFYNRYYRRFTLCDLTNVRNLFPDGFICDWQNKREYSMLQIIENKVQEYNPDLITNL